MDVSHKETFYPRVTRIIEQDDSKIVDDELKTNSSENGLGASSSVQFQANLTEDDYLPGHRIELNDVELRAFAGEYTEVYSVEDSDTMSTEETGTQLAMNVIDYDTAVKAAEAWNQNKPSKTKSEAKTEGHMVSDDDRVHVDHKNSTSTGEADERTDSKKGKQTLPVKEQQTVSQYDSCCKYAGVR